VFVTRLAPVPRDMGGFWGRYSDDYAKVEAKAEAEAGEDFSLDATKIKKTEVDLCFLGSTSKWGRLEDDPDRDATLLFLVVKFSQLSEYKLSNATIELSFDTIHLEKDLEISEGRRIVTVTDHLAPMFLCGPESERKVNSSMKFIPELGIGNIANIAGVGIDTAQEMVKKAWWIFSGDRVQNNKLGGHYMDVRWLWESNPLNKQIENLFEVCLRWSQQSQLVHCGA